MVSATPMKRSFFAWSGSKPYPFSDESCPHCAGGMGPVSGTARPWNSDWLIACLSTARFSARRTRKDYARCVQELLEVHYPQAVKVRLVQDNLNTHDGASLYDLLAAPCLECWTTLTMLTMATHRLYGIPMVLSHTYRHPTVLAKMAATLDEASGGRLVLGLGAGGSQRDHEAAGIPWRPLQERLVQLEEGIQLIRFLWSGQEGPFKSRFYGTVEGGGYPRPITLTK